MNKNQFHYGGHRYEYELVKENRKTLSLTVRPDMSILLKTPFQADSNHIEIFLKRKWLWLERQLKFFKKYQRKIYKKEHISGESFLYLGRQYKLKVIKGRQDNISLTKGVLRLTTTKKTSDNDHNRTVLNKWYQERTKAIFKKRYQIVLNNFNYDFIPRLSTRKMLKRWGSCVDKKRIVLNPSLIKTSTDCIDYVITHEFCHIRYENHNAKFYEYLEKKYPDWQRIKEKLELRLG